MSKYLDIKFNVDKNLILQSEPLEGYEPTDILQIISEHSDPETLADAFAAVFNEGVYIVERLENSYMSEPRRQELLATYSAWHEVEIFLCNSILPLIGFDVRSDGEPPIGYYHILTPFMRSFGYCACGNIYTNYIM